MIFTYLPQQQKHRINMTQYRKHELHYWSFVNCW